MISGDEPALTTERTNPENRTESSRDNEDNWNLKPTAFRPSGILPQEPNTTLQFQFLRFLCYLLFKFSSFPFVLAEGPQNDLLGLADDGIEMFGAFEAFRVEFVDVLCPGRAGGEPAAHRDDL